MIEGKSTKLAGGLEVTGSFPDLKKLHRAIHTVVEHADLSPILGDTLLGLAYEVRKAYESLYGPRPTKEPKGTASFVVAWPVVMFQLVLLRQALRPAVMDLEGMASLVRLEYAAETGLWGLGDHVAVPAVFWLRGTQEVGNDYLVQHLTLLTDSYLFDGPAGKKRAAILPNVLVALEEDSMAYRRTRKHAESEAKRLGCTVHELRYPDDNERRPIRW